MTINGLALPADFVTAVSQGALRRSRGCWQLLDDLDAWGQPLQMEIGEIFEDIECLEKETKGLTRDFPSDPLDGADISENEPGFVPYIIDFTKVVCFGVSGEDAPLCFDFRADLQNPEVIWWEDAFWRRIAPDWTSFAALFNLTPPTAHE